MDHHLLMGVEIWKKNFGTSTTIFFKEFLQIFKNYIAEFAKIYLDYDQTMFLTSLLDPTNSNTLDFLEYLIFFENFWLVPSKRMRLFKHKFSEIPDFYAPLAIKLQFIIFNTFSKASKTLYFDLDFNKVMNCGNDPFSNDLVIPELKNSKQLGLIRVENGILLRDYGKNNFRGYLDIEKEKILLDKDMIIKIGKETTLRIKKIYPHKWCDGNDNKHVAFNAEHKGFDQELLEFYKMQKNEESAFKDVKAFRESKEKRQENAKFHNLVEKEKILLLEINEDNHKIREVQLVPNLEKQEFFIGRGEIKTLDIVLKDMSVSKKHCLISFDNKCGWIIQENIDAPSYFGTYVCLANYQEIQENLASKCNLFKKKTILNLDEEILLLIDFKILN